MSLMVCATTIGLTERLKTALAAFGTDEQRLTPQQLATLDQFHTRGLALVPAYHECLHRAARTRYASERCRRTWPAAIRAGVDERNLRSHRKTHTDASDRETAGDVSGTFRRYKPTASTDQPQPATPTVSGQPQPPWSGTTQPPAEPDIPVAYGITVNGPTTDLVTELFGPRRRDGQ